MELREMIYKRKSTRSYTGEPVEEETIQKIREFAAAAKTLYPDIRVRTEIVEGSKVRCILPWTTPQMIAIYSEPKEGYEQNAGFLYQQVDLYLQSLGLGTCWLGMGKPDAKTDKLLAGEDGFSFVILIAFGKPKGEWLRKETSEFKRKPLTAISDKEDTRLEPARLAPSSVNSQPWYFVHEKDTIHLYCAYSGIFSKKKTSHMNRIDVGIALAQLYVENPETFRFFKVEQPPKQNGYGYVGSFTL